MSTWRYFIAANNGPTPPQPRKPDVFDYCAAQRQAAVAPYWSQAKTGFGLGNFYGGGISGYQGYLGKGAIGGVYGFIGGYLAKPVGNLVAGQQAYDSATTSCLNANGIDTNAYIK